jgi:hypothetical protein
MTLTLFLALASPDAGLPITFAPAASLLPFLAAEARVGTGLVDPAVLPRLSVRSASAPLPVRGN